MQMHAFSYFAIFSAKLQRSESGDVSNDREKYSLQNWALSVSFDHGSDYRGEKIDFSISRVSEFFLEKVIETRWYQNSETMVGKLITNCIDSYPYMSENICATHVMNFIRTSMGETKKADSLCSLSHWSEPRRIISCSSSGHRGALAGPCPTSKSVTSSSPRSKLLRLEKLQFWCNRATRNGLCSPREIFASQNSCPTICAHEIDEGNRRIDRIGVTSLRLLETVGVVQSHWLMWGWWSVFESLSQIHQIDRRNGQEPFGRTAVDRTTKRSWCPVHGLRRRLHLTMFLQGIGIVGRIVLAWVLPWNRLALDCLWWEPHELERLTVTCDGKQNFQVPAGISAVPRWFLLPPAHKYQSATHLLASPEVPDDNIGEIDALQVVCPDSESSVSGSIGDASSLKSVGPRHLGRGSTEPLLGSLRESRLYKMSPIFREKVLERCHETQEWWIVR